MHKSHEIEDDEDLESEKLPQSRSRAEKKKATPDLDDMDFARHYSKKTRLNKRTGCFVSIFVCNVCDKEIR